MPWSLRSIFAAAVALGLAPACSDDGLTPSAGGTASDGGGGGSTGSVSTTVTASAGGGDPAGTAPAGDDADDGVDGTGARSDTGADDGTARPDDSGGLSGSSGGDDLDPGSTDDAGSSSEGDTGPPPQGSPCVTAADCVVVDDCCACTAAGVDDPAVPCEEKCDVTQCTSAGVASPAAECVFGQCRLEKVPCNGAFLACDQPAPDCPEGQLPSVDDDASCWTGACVNADLCDIVPGCSWCAPEEACVLASTQIAPLYSCWPIDPSCDGEPSCACMAEVCTDPFMCGEPGAGEHDLGCFCPVCG